METAYPQNPNLIPAFAGVGIQYFGSDASKAYPDPSIPGSTAPAYPAGSTFTDGTGQAIPRYPTNIYYNVSTEAEAVDEFNTLYTPVAQGGKCVASATTTCETSPATFADVVRNVDTNMFQHVMGNDPRPHYFHQPNLMGSPPPGPATTGTPPATPKNVGDGLFYSVLNPLLEQYYQYFNAPIEQPTMAQIGQLLAEQTAWSNALSSGRVSGYIEGNQVTVSNSDHRGQRPAHRRHRGRVRIWRGPVRMDEPAGVREHLLGPDVVAGSRRSAEDHDQPVQQDRDGRRKRDLHGSSLRRSGAHRAVAGVDQRRRHVRQRHDRRGQHDRHVDGREHDCCSERPPVPRGVHQPDRVGDDHGGDADGQRET